MRNIILIISSKVYDICSFRALCALLYSVNVVLIGIYFIIFGIIAIVMRFTWGKVTIPIGRCNRTINQAPLATRIALHASWWCDGHTFTRSAESFVFMVTIQCIRHLFCHNFRIAQVLRVHLESPHSQPAVRFWTQQWSKVATHGQCNTYRSSCTLRKFIHRLHCMIRLVIPNRVINTESNIP